MTIPRYDHFINGAVVAPSGGEYMDVYNPATGEVIAQVACGTAQDVDAAVAAAQAAFAAQAACDLFKERSQWNQARVYAKQGNKQKAVEMYKELLAKGDPKSSLRDDIQNRLAQLEQ